MKTSKAIIIASVIFLVGIVFYSLSNRYYIDTSTKLVVDRLTGKVTRPVVSMPTSTPAPTQRYTAPEINKGDFSKVVISGESKSVNSIKYEITCTVKNDDSMPHHLSVKAIFYDKNKSPILTEDSKSITVNPNDIGSVVIYTMQSVENISSHELKLMQSIFDGV